MKPYYILISLLLYISCKSQPKLKEGERFYKEIGWTVSFPKDQTFKNTDQIDSLQRETFKKIYDGQGKEFKGVPYKTIFFIAEGYNGFNSTIEKYDTHEYKTWQQLHAADRAVILSNLESFKANAILKDSSTTFETIDGLKFEKFSFQLFAASNNMTMTSHWYAAEKNGYNWVINISYVDEAAGKKYFDILQNSRIEK